MPFSKRTLEFLFENRLNDSKEWFHEHKPLYQETVIKPFTELLSELSPMFDTIDSKLICEPKRISRIYRDIRFSKDKSLFRDDLWVTVSRPKDKYELPCFYFDLNQSGFSYGCGYYMPSRDTTDAIRSLILSNDKSFKAALKAMKKQCVFTLGGDMYKRSRYPQQSEECRNWLDRKSIYFYCDNHDFDLLFSDKLAEKLKSDFLTLAPIYNFFCEAEKLAVKTRNTVQE